jgi:translation initiation factor IF-3
MDYGKYKYEQDRRPASPAATSSRPWSRKQKFRPKISDNDYETKKGNVVKFLSKGSKVKVTIMFRGREQSRPELGFRLLERLAEDVKEYGVVETRAKQDGRNMTMVLGPVRKGKK